MMVGFADIHDAPLPQLLRWWDGIDPPLADFGEGFFDELAYGLTKYRPEGIVALKSYLDSHDLKRRYAALWFLAYPGIADEEVRDALVQAFRHGSRDLKYRALWGFIHLAYFPLSRQQVEVVSGGSDERMSALAMVYISRALPDEMVEILAAGLSSPNPRKREYACDEVGDRGIDELSELLRPLLTDKDQAVAEAARSNLAFFSDE